MSNHIWSYRSMWKSSYLIFVIISDHLWPHQIKSDQIWSTLTSSDQIWSHPIRYDQIWPHQITSDQIWSRWSYLTSSDQLWPHPIRFDLLCERGEDGDVVATDQQDGWKVPDHRYHDHPSWSSWRSWSWPSWWYDDIIMINFRSRVINTIIIKISVATDQQDGRKIPDQ